jgi:hypothetical protein
VKATSTGKLLNILPRNYALAELCSNTIMPSFGYITLIFCIMLLKIMFSLLQTASLKPPIVILAKTRNCYVRNDLFGNDFVVAAVGNKK